MRQQLAVHQGGRYDASMRPVDTSKEAYQVQIAIWRRMGERGTAELAIL